MRKLLFVLVLMLSTGLSAQIIREGNMLTVGTATYTLVDGYNPVIKISEEHNPDPAYMAASDVQYCVSENVTFTMTDWQNYYIYLNRGEYRFYLYGFNEPPHRYNWFRVQFPDNSDYVFQHGFNDNHGHRTSIRERAFFGAPRLTSSYIPDRSWYVWRMLTTEYSTDCEGYSLTRQPAIDTNYYGYWVTNCERGELEIGNEFHSFETTPTDSSFSNLQTNLNGNRFVYYFDQRTRTSQTRMITMYNGVVVGVVNTNTNPPCQVIDRGRRGFIAGPTQDECNEASGWTETQKLYSNTPAHSWGINIGGNTPIRLYRNNITNQIVETNKWYSVSITGNYARNYGDLYVVHVDENGYVDEYYPECYTNDCRCDIESISTLQLLINRGSSFEIGSNNERVRIVRNGSTWTHIYDNDGNFIPEGVYTTPPNQNNGEFSASGFRIELNNVGEIISITRA